MNAPDLGTRVTRLEERGDASRAWQASHETKCAERHKATDDSITRLHERLDKLGYAIGAAAFSAVLTLITVLAQVVLRPPH